MDGQSDTEIVMEKMLAAAHIPSCMICHARIVGAHIDYMDKNRVPRKVCTGCIFKAIDFYTNAQEEGIKR